jgi:hypothetical protein
METAQESLNKISRDLAQVAALQARILASIERCEGMLCLPSPIVLKYTNPLRPVS